MKELTLEQAQEVNGGNPYVIGAVVGWAVGEVLDEVKNGLSEIDWGSSMNNPDTNLAA